MSCWCFKQALKLKEYRHCQKTQQTRELSNFVKVTLQTSQEQAIFEFWWNYKLWPKAVVKLSPSCRQRSLPVRNGKHLFVFCLKGNRCPTSPRNVEPPSLFPPGLRSWNPNIDVLTQIPTCNPRFRSRLLIQIFRFPGFSEEIWNSINKMSS